jgi:RinA family phage transcriptional activator
VNLFSLLFVGACYGVTTQVNDYPIVAVFYLVNAAGCGRAVFRCIEHELYNYDTTLKEMRDLRERIIEAPPLREAVSGTGHVSDPTARKATQLVTNTDLARMARMARTVAAIDKSLARLSEDHRALFELKYRQTMPWRRVCRELLTSERTCFRIRRELVEIVALEMDLAESWQK